MLRLFPYIVVSYWNSTSNHNFQTLETLDVKLYLIEILHQTTTPRLSHRRRLMLYLIEILHQTTTWSAAFEFLLCCILLKFYIKPQLHREYNHELCVVSYWNSTSNHNGALEYLGCSGLYLIEILHQTTTTAASSGLFFSCILLKFYIKPQPIPSRLGLWKVVSYWNSTSNHNLSFYQLVRPICCILLKFYIKPQLCRKRPNFCCVVSYWNSTSNHNYNRAAVKNGRVVSYWNSTSNHNCIPCIAFCNLVVSYWNSTSNHNSVF